MKVNIGLRAAVEGKGHALELSQVAQIAVVAAPSEAWSTYWSF